MEGVVLRACVCSGSVEGFWAVEGGPRYWLSPPSFPFFMVHFECRDLVIKVGLEEWFLGGVMGRRGSSGERGRCCPHSCCGKSSMRLPRLARW